MPVQFQHALVEQDSGRVITDAQNRPTHKLDPHTCGAKSAEVSLLLELGPCAVLTVVNAQIALLWFRMPKENCEFLLRFAELTL
jgi:hypothetical protein